MAFEDLIQAAAKKYMVDPHLLAAIMMQESSGNPKAVGTRTRTGEQAHGLMQLMPSTAKKHNVTDVFDPAQSIDAGAAEFAEMLDRYNGNTELALAAYNAGPGAVDQYGGVPPYPETQNYVRNILQRPADKAQKGMVTYEATGPDGNKVRIQAPRGADMSTVRTQFEAEFNRHKKGEESRKETVQPVKGFDPYEFARKTVRELPGAAVRAGEETVKSWIKDPLVGFGGPGDLSQPGALERGMSPESIPIVGSLIRMTKGEFSPAEAADWAINTGRAGIGGGTSKALGVRDVEQIPRGVKRAFQEPGYSKGGAALGAAAGGGVGEATSRAFGLPYQVGLYPGMAVGGAVGSRVPSMASGFMRGLREPYTKPAPIESVQAEYSPSPTANARMTPRLQNTIDIRTEASQPMPPAQQPKLAPVLQMPPRAIEAGPDLSGTTIAPSTGPALPQPSAKVLQMPPAREVPIYGGKPGLAKSSESGMYVPRQRKLSLYQEGANIPSSEPAPTPEQIGQKLIPNIRREAMSKAGEERQPQPTSTQLERAEEKPPKAEVKEMPKATGKVILPSSVKEYSRVHGLSLEEAEKHFRDQGYEIRKRSLKKT